MTSASQTTPRTALIIGATGSFGLHALEALAKRGWRIRALARDPAKGADRVGPRTPVEWVLGDAMDTNSVVSAADGVQLIVHAVNPPAYRNWKGTVLPMIESSIAAARASGARIVVPASVYNYAPDSGSEIGENAPQAPVTRKGKIRVEMERRLRAASQEGVKVLILRAGDFFGPAAPNSALAWLTLRGKDRVTGVFRAGPADVGHAFVYMPDLGETLARLVDAEDRLGAFEAFHVRGHWLARSGELGEAIRRVTGRPGLPIIGFPWIVVHAAAPFVETFRELLEMRYLWRRPIGLANAKLVAFLGEEPHTPLDAALRATLSDMGCLPDEAGHASDQPSTICSNSAIAPTM
ncbi:MAG TPA: NAD(P)H-binding protein [Caulobacteraceae bacterium]|nr:NAD(P)H-binding protein [Caulobacteraceae bacterium]